jgi:hypothetical protein
VPHAAQNVRTTVAEDRSVVGVPATKLKSALRNVTHGTSGAAAISRQVLQWQIKLPSGRELERYLTEPQKHPPSMFTSATSMQLQWRSRSHSHNEQLTLDGDARSK